MTLSPIDDRDPAPVRRDYAAIDVQLVRCPFCRKPVPGLLAGCDEPECRSLELDDDRRFEWSSEQ